MRYPALLFGLALISSGCEPDWPDPPPIDAETLLAEHEEWRLNREQSLVAPPGGAVLWNGLWDIPQGDTEFGSDDGHVITLSPGDSPPLAGVLRRDGQVITLLPAPNSGIHVRTTDPDNEEVVIETPVTEPMILENDRSGKTTTLTLGSLGMRVHMEPGSDRLWLRTWDEDMPERETFALPEYFPIAEEWRVAARFDEYDEPATLLFADVAGGMVEYSAPGELVFQLSGEERRLIVTRGETSSTYFILIWDSTATENTYQGGRYVRAPFPDSTGWTVLDFNRTYNAPCVFTAYSVCSLPPLDNWLRVHIRAGEQRPEKSTY